MNRQQQIVLEDYELNARMIWIFSIIHKGNHLSHYKFELLDENDDATNTFIESDLTEAIKKWHSITGRK